MNLVVDFFQIVGMCVSAFAVGYVGLFIWTIIRWGK